MAGVGWKCQLAAPTVHGILTFELLDRAMTAVVTEQPFTGRHLNDRSGHFLPSNPIGAKSDLTLL